MPGTRKLGRTTAHRKAMLRGLVTLLLENGKVACAHAISWCECPAVL